MEATAIKLWNKNFLLMVSGQFISIFGNAVLTFALPLYILYLTDSAALYGLVLGLPYAAFLIASPIGGLMADRLKKQRIMFWLDTTVTAIIVLFTIASGLFIAIVPIVILKLFALNAIQSMYTPTVYASIPLLTPSDKLVRANSVVTTVDTISNLAAPAAAGFLFISFGLFPILVVCAICFAITAIIDLFIRIPYEKQQTNRGILQIVKSDMTEAIHFIIKKNATLIRIAVLYFVVPMLVGPIIVVGIPIFITQHFDMGMEYIGIIKTIGWGGAVLGSLLAGFLGERLSIKSVPLTSILLGLTIVPIGAILLFTIPFFASYVIMTIAAVAYFAVFILFIIPINAHIQKVVPEELLGKVASLFNVIPFFASGVGFTLFGILFEQFYSVSWLVIFVAALICSIVTLILRKQFMEAKADV